MSVNVLHNDFKLYMYIHGAGNALCRSKLSFFLQKIMWSLKNLFEKFSRNIHCASYK